MTTPKIEFIEGMVADVPDAKLTTPALGQLALQAGFANVPVMFRDPDGYVQDLHGHHARFARITEENGSTFTALIITPDY